MSKSLNWWTRKTHRWLAILVAVPLLVVICSGLLLQLKKQIPWIQPPTDSGSSGVPSVSWQRILQVAQDHESAGVEDWNDIDRLDLQINRGVTKVICVNGWELQLDSATGELLSSAIRRSDLIEDIHDGTWFTEPAKLWIFLPSGIALLVLWITGVYLWILPVAIRRRRIRAANLNKPNSRPMAR